MKTLSPTKVRKKKIEAVIKRFYPHGGADECLRILKQIGYDLARPTIFGYAQKMGIRKLCRNEALVGERGLIGNTPAEVVAAVDKAGIEVKLFPENHDPLLATMDAKNWGNQRMVPTKHIDWLHNGDFLCFRCNKVRDKSRRRQSNTTCSVCKSCYNKQRNDYRKNNEQAFNRSKAQTYLNSVISGKLLAKRGSVAYKLFGATTEEIKSHIENQFEDGWNWENRGDVWEIDHIRPYSSFDLTDDKQYRECCNYKNIRPLSVKENRTRVKRTKKL